MRWSRSRIFAAAAASLAALYAALGFWAAPSLVERAIVKIAAEQLDRKATVGEVRVNPLLFRVELKDLALTELDGAPIVGVKRLLVDFELSSLVRWAWTFSEIAVDGLDLRADIAPDGRFNLAALLDKLPQKERQSGDRPPRLLLQRLVLSAGTIAFSDRSDRTPARTVLSPINVELNDISTLADHRGAYSVSARLTDGGTFAWRGEASLQPLASQGEISVVGANPLAVWRFFQDELGLAEPRGELDFSARYRIAYSAGMPQFALEDVRMAGRGVSLALAGAKEPLLALATMEATGGRFDLAARELAFAGVELRDGAIAAEVDRNGVIDWQQIIKTDRKSEPRQPPAAGAPPKPWKARVDSVRVGGVALRYVDRSRARPLLLVAKDVTASLSATIETRADGPQLLLEGIAVSVAQPQAGELGVAEPLATLDSVALEGGSVNLAERSVAVGRVAAKGGVARLTRDKEGVPAGLLSFAVADAGLVRREVAGALKQAKAAGAPWRVAVDAIEVTGIRIALSDQSFGEPAAYDADVVSARMLGFRSDGKQPVKIETSIRIAQGGSIAVSGALRLQGDQVAARVRLNGINLKPLRPVLFRHVRMALASGELSADINADYRAREGRHELRATGQASIDNLRLNETASGENLIGWKSLSAKGISFSLSPDDLKVDEGRITGLDAKVVVFKDRSLNLTNAIVAEPLRSGGEARPAPPPAAAGGDLATRFPMSLRRLNFDEGNVDFTDLSLALPFAAKVHALSGSVQGISSERASRASVRLEGGVDEFGLARAEGSLSPFRPKSFLDLTVTFRNVDMPRLSPYSVTFAGRRIASGRLALDLRYKMENGVLAGDNRVVLEKFTLGERVETPGATDLPLDLAIALLTDSDGKIDISVPVSGNVDDPQFSYGHVVWQAITTVLTRIVTAPFRALGALFGGSAESLESISFDPGRATLLPPEREKLKRVAEGLAKRPQIRLIAEGQYGAADRAALRRRDIELSVAAKLDRAPAPGSAPEPVDVMDAKSQRALEAIYTERQSGEALAQFAAETEKSRGKEVQRVNAALALVGRGSADRAFYEALLKRLVDTAPVTDAALAQLAGARARAVTENLASEFAVPAARAEAKTAAAPGAEQVKLSFDVTK